MKKLLIILCGLVPLLSSALHPLHISVTNIDYNGENNSLEITHKIFMDDLEQAIEGIGGPKLQLGTKFEHPESEKWLSQYLQQHFTLTVNNKEVAFNYVGREADLSAIWIYREVLKVKKVKSLQIDCDFLTEQFDDQRNIIHLKYEDKEESFLMNKNNTTETFTP
ncbi:DUF6702 family protein [Limibacter armeniacum]|uniref:DUF6702 family protein n=1 Tax=Limibacter armeniacum TaxID=466084 RepID=UPI002FE66C45